MSQHDIKSLDDKNNQSIIKEEEDKDNKGIMHLSTLANI